MANLLFWYINTWSRFFCNPCFVCCLFVFSRSVGNRALCSLKLMSKRCSIKIIGWVWTTSWISNFALKFCSCQYLDIKSSSQILLALLVLDIITKKNLSAMEAFNQHVSARLFAARFVQMVLCLTFLSAMASAKIQTQTFVVRPLTFNIFLSILIAMF